MEDGAEFFVALPAARKDATLLTLNTLISLLNDDSIFQGSQSESRFEEAILELHSRLQVYRDPGLNQFFLIEAARAQSFPVVWLDQQILCIGHGKTSRLFSSTLSDKTGVIGVSLAKNKHKTSCFLRICGLPGSINKLVKSQSEAILAANELGYPVVIKPNNCDRGLGVSADLRSERDVLTGYQNALKYSDDILLEKHIDGFTHRLTVVEGKVIKVVKRIAAGVVGDGASTIAELIEKSSKNSVKSSSIKQPLVLDDEVLGLLAQQKKNLYSILGRGEYLRLRRRDNVSAGGTNSNIDLGMVHPENIDLACIAARLLRLDIAGIDLITTDISNSWRVNGATICEVNSQPQLADSEDNSLYTFILNRYFPIAPEIYIEIAIAVDERKITPEALASLANKGPSHCVSHRSGLLINGKLSTITFKSNFYAAQAAVLRPDVASLTYVMTIEEVLNNGLPIDRWHNLMVLDDQKLGRELQRELNKLIFPHQRAWRNQGG